MMVIMPVPVTDAVLVSSSVAENDHPEWAADTTYALGDQVIKAATHRIYESAIGGNIGHEPTDPANTQWFEVGPTNRWGMFHQAPETSTSAPGSIAVTLAPGIIDALAVASGSAAAVRVRVVIGGATVYDETQVPDPVRPILNFLDLPSAFGAQILLSATGGGTVTIGTVVLGNLLQLGDTETSPSIGIVDYSKRTTDDFGVTKVVPRGWAKTMSLRTRLPTGNVDHVQLAVGLLRATPTVWIGELGFESLTIMGFAKNFSAEFSSHAFSYGTFSIEGLTT